MRAPIGEEIKRGEDSWDIIRDGERIKKVYKGVTPFLPMKKGVNYPIKNSFFLQLFYSPIKLKKVKLD